MLHIWHIINQIYIQCGSKGCAEIDGAVRGVEIKKKTLYKEHLVLQVILR
jgi:hypothetical protein